MNKTLSNIYPISDEFVDTKAFKYKDYLVEEEFESYDTPWIGTHKNVHNWCILKNGLAVGWNENPAIGWSFIVVGRKKVNEFKKTRKLK